MLRAREVGTLDCKVVGVAVRAQFVEFVKHDLLHVPPLPGTRYYTPLPVTLLYVHPM